MHAPPLFEHLALAVYSLMAWAAQPLLRAKLARRARAEPLYAEHMGERFGYYADMADVAPQDPGPLVWLHAVSLGETRAAAILLPALRARIPGMRLLLTHGTATGRAEGAKLLQAGDVQTWLPWDAPGAVARFLTRFKPRMGLLLETEVWPNLVAACQARHIPLLLVNARLSEKSLRQAQRLAWLARPAYRGLHAAYAQTEADALRLARLGTHIDAVLGNVKFDAAPNAAQLAQGRVWRAGMLRPVVLLASSREGEEALFLEKIMAVRRIERGYTATKNVASNGMDHGALPVQWLIVPRHPQRFDDVAALIVQQGFSVSRRSTWGSAPPSSAVAASAQDATPPAAQDGAAADCIWLGDSLGEMPLYYGLASAALLGGSFEKLGGQNLIEAAACACPVIMGPHTFNFAQAAELAQAAGAAFEVEDMAHALERAAQLLGQGMGSGMGDSLGSSAELQQAQAAALAFVAAHSGAAEQTALRVAAVLAE